MRALLPGRGDGAAVLAGAMSGQERTYRRWVQSDLHTFEVRVKESDLLISAARPLRQAAERALRSARAEIEGYAARDAGFAEALEPRDALPGAPEIVLAMVEAARVCGVGPMAAVAGAVAQRVGDVLLEQTSEVIVENGGDIFLYTRRPRVAALYAGKSSLTARVGMRIGRVNERLGLCTSSGTVGHSTSYGRADAAIVLAESAALADAAATALGNRIQGPADIEPGLECLKGVSGVLGGAIVLSEHLGAWGEIELIALQSGEGR